MLALVFIYFFLCGFLSAQSPPEKVEVNGVEYKVIFVGDGPSLLIVNGQESQISERPYMASLQVEIPPYGWFHFCSAVICEKKKLVSAAHCLIPFPASSTRVVVGIQDLNNPSAYTQIHKVSALVPREDFSVTPTAFLNDIGVVLLQTPIKYNPNVMPAKLANFQNCARNDCLIAGWGSTTPEGPASTALLEAKIAALSFTECLAIHQQFGLTVTQKQICVRDDGTDGIISAPCFGDSGGPLVCGKNFKYIYGVTSYTLDNCQGKLPAVYTSVGSYIQWIKDQ